MALHFPPGLNERPSSWPIRQQRRHFAVTSFNTQVLTRLADIERNLNSVSKINDSIKQLDDKLNVVLHNIGSNVAATPSLEQMHDDIKKRVDSMEILLFKTSLQDFMAIDRRIASIKEHLELARDAQQCFRLGEPESEQSPQKPQSIPENRCIDGCRLFDIFESAIEATTQTDVTVTNAREAVTIEASSQTNRIANNRRSRCNGRASQTSLSMMQTMTSATQTLKDAIDDYGLVSSSIQRLGEGHERLGEEDLAQLTPKDQRFVVEMMKQLEENIDKRLNRR